MRRAGTHRPRVMLVHRRRQKKERKESMKNKETRMAELLNQMNDQQKDALLALLECLLHSQEHAVNCDRKAD